METLTSEIGDRAANALYLENEMSRGYGGYLWRVLRARESLANVAANRSAWERHR